MLFSILLSITVLNRYLVLDLEYYYIMLFRVLQVRVWGFVLVSTATQKSVRVFSFYILNSKKKNYLMKASYWFHTNHFRRGKIRNKRKRIQFIGLIYTFRLTYYLHTQGRIYTHTTFSLSKSTQFVMLQVILVWQEFSFFFWQNSIS